MTRLNNFAGTLVVLVVFLSPIPFGSNRPFFWAISGLIVGLAAIVYFSSAFRHKHELRIAFNKIGFSVGLWLIVVGYLIIQALPLGSVMGPFVIELPNGSEIFSNTISAAPGATWLMSIRMLTYGLFFMLALQAGANEGRSNIMLRFIFWGIVAHAGFALIQLNQLGDTLLGLPKPGYLGSATGTFVNRNSFATFLAMGMSVGVSLLPSLVTSESARNATRADTLSGVMFHVAGMLVLLVTLLATQSRMGLFAGVLGSFVVFLIVLKRHPRWKLLLPVAMLLALFASVLLLWAFGQGVIERVLDLGGSSRGRMDLYAQVWETILLRPLLGYGGGSFSLVFPAFFGPPLNLTRFYDSAHSTYLALFFELGLGVGSLLILATLMMFLRIVWSQISDVRMDAARLAAIGTLITCAVHSTVDFSLEIQANTFLFAAVVSLGLSATFRRSTNWSTR